MGAEEYAKLEGLSAEMQKDTDGLRRQSLNNGSGNAQLLILILLMSMLLFLLQKFLLLNAPILTPLQHTLHHP